MNDRNIKVGDPTDAATWMGALISREHLEKVRNYVQFARDEGCTVSCGESVEELNIGAAFQKVFIALVPLVWTFFRSQLSWRKFIEDPVHFQYNECTSHAYYIHAYTVDLLLPDCILAEYLKKIGLFHAPDRDRRRQGFISTDAGGNIWTGRLRRSIRFRRGSELRAVFM